MKELKATHIIMVYNGEIYEDFETVPCTQLYYRKDEADKVIAELKADYKEACDRLQTANLIKDEQIAATRHNKNKRCLAMAMWCDSENYTACWYHENSERCKWTEKWHKCWFELAKQFKEAK